MPLCKDRVPGKMGRVRECRPVELDLEEMEANIARRTRKWLILQMELLL